eukprot:PRCOL_00000443-RA
MGVALAEASGDGDPLLAPLEGFGDAVCCEAVDGAAMSTVEFDRRYLAKAFPAVLRGLTDGWAAMEEGGSRRWDLDFFRREYGELPVQVDAGGDTFGARRQLTMAEYIDAFDDLTAAAEEAGASPPPYLRTWNYEDEVPELGSDWSTPALFRDMFQALPPVARPPFTWLFLCPRGATTRLHVDVWHTDAWLVNALGRKRFVLFHPAQRKYIEDGQGFVDLRSPDLERFPDLAKATPVEFVLGPGEIAYIPRKWPHFAVALEPSVSLTVNFACKASMRDVLPLAKRYAKRRSMCEDMLGRTLKASDNLLKFCVHGGELNVEIAASILKMKRDELLRQAGADEADGNDGDALSG